MILQSRTKNMKYKNTRQNKGQVAIIVLLASAIILTLGLSASKKAITDTKIDTDEQLLKEAFNAAESGINNFLNNSSNNSYTDSNGNSAKVSTSDIGGVGSSLSSEGVILANSSQLFWLVNHEDNGDIGNVYYGGNSILVDVGSFSGALKIDYFYIQGGVYKVDRIGCNYGGSSTVTGFGDSSTCSSIDTSDKNSLLLAITPLGASTKITVSGATFPKQGLELTSVGTAGDGIKTQVKTRSTYQLPSFFMDAVTSGSVIQ